MDQSLPGPVVERNDVHVVVEVVDAEEKRHEHEVAIGGFARDRVPQCAEEQNHENSQHGSDASKADAQQRCAVEARGQQAIGPDLDGREPGGQAGMRLETNDQFVVTRVEDRPGERKIDRSIPVLGASLSEPGTASDPLAVEVDRRVGVDMRQQHAPALLGWRIDDESRSVPSHTGDSR